MKKQTTIKPYYAWLVWGVGAVFVLYQFLLQSSTSIMVPQLKHAFHTDTIGVSLISSSYFYTYVLAQIPAGLLIDRLGPRKLLGSTIFVCALATLWFACSHSMLAAELSRLLMGLVASTSVVSALYLAVTWFSPSRFALLVGLTELLGMWGGGIGQIILSHFIDSALGWRGTMLLCAMFGVLLAVVAWWVVYDSPVHKRTKKHRVKSAASNMSFQQIIRVIAMPRIWIVGLYSGFMFAVSSAFATLWAIQFYVNTYHLSLELSGLMSGLIFVGAGMFSPVIGMISDRIGRRVLPMRVSALCAFLIMGLLVFVPHWSVPMLCVLSLLLGMVSAGYCLPFAYADDITAPKFKATAMGLVNTLCIIVGAPLMQLLIGWLLARTHHNYMLSLSVVSLGFFMAFCLTFFMKETHCERQYVSDKDVIYGLKTIHSELP